MRPTVRRRASGTRRIPLTRGLTIITSAVLALVFGAVLTPQAQAQTHQHAAARQAAAPRVSHHQSPDSGPAVHHDTSLPLRVLAARARLHPAPHTGPATPGRSLRVPHPAAAQHPDPVVQSHAGTRPAVATITNFDGVSGGQCGCTPPDPNAAVGTTQVAEISNVAFAVYSKTGGTIMAPTATNSLWSGFGGFCQSANDGDATVAFDRLADRWVIQQFANVTSASGPYFECVAVSTTADATGTYNRYSFQFSTFPDYPKLSVWPDAYYTTYNMFTPAGAFIDAEICAMNRASMLTGAAATQQCFTTDANHGGILAADLDGSTPPPSGEPETVMGLGTTSTTLAFWHFHVDFTTPANSTFTGPTNLTVASYTTACGGGTCIPQGGNSQQLDSLADRIMYRLAYRNNGGTESLLTNDAVTAGSSTGIRWYEFRLSGGNPAVFQQGTYAPDSTFRWMGSIAMDHAGNIALGYSQSSSTTNPSIRFTGRAPGDPLGTMTQAETTVFTGGGTETGASRWGDYTSMSIDPSDDCTFWYTNEYYPAGTSSFAGWNTRLASFQLPGCSNTGSSFTISDSPASGSVSPGGSATSTVSVNETGAAQTVNLTASGLPSGATASFNPSSVSATGTSALTISTTTATPPGSYPITITGTGTSGTQTTTFTLTVNAATGFTISDSPASGTVTAGGSATSTVTVTETGTAQTVNLSASGLPAGATSSFNPASLSASGTSAMTISTTTATPAGTYSITITGTGTSGTQTATFTLTVNAAGGCTAKQLLGNPGFETGAAAPWTLTAGVLNNSTAEPPHTGKWDAWLDGYGTTHTDTAAQTVTLPTGCTTYQASFWLHIDTAETTTTTAFDTLKVQVLNSAGTVLATLATFSNLNAAAGYFNHAYNLAAFAGQTITLKFTGHEDASLQTSFVIDDTAINVS